MALVTAGVNSQTVTVATEIGLAQSPVNPSAVPAGAVAVISGVVACAAGTGGTQATVKVRQGVGTGGTQVQANIVGATGTANAATSVAFTVVDPAPPANGVYTVTLTFAGNTSSVVTSAVAVELIEGVLANV